VGPPAAGPAAGTAVSWARCSTGEGSACPAAHVTLVFLAETTPGRWREKETGPNQAFCTRYLFSSLSPRRPSVAEPRSDGL